MQKKLHIVSFDVPFPADYGGVIDVYNRIVALHQSGCSITLHCFDYGRDEQKALKKVTQQVFYYKRKSKALSSASKKPMIVASRENEELLKNLLKDDAPILFEGQHCTAFLDHAQLKNRIKWVRLHNVEHHYYQALGESETHFLKKKFFLNEAKKLKKHESVLTHANQLLCITQGDLEYYSKRFKNALLLPAAFDKEDNRYIEKKKDFILFHGNLTVAENIKALQWILREVLPDLSKKLVIAGKYDKQKRLSLFTKIEQTKGLEFCPNPSKEKMNQLLDEAAAHLLISFQATGIKLKLIHALLTSGHVIANPLMVKNSGLEKWCEVLSTGSEISERLNAITLDPISIKTHEERVKFITNRHGELNQVKIIEQLLKKNN